MTDFQHFLSPALVSARCDVTSKKALFSQLAELGGKASGLPATTVGESLWLRERLGPTGFGGASAIPHARLDKLTAFHMAVLTLAEPIDYDAVDARPVDLVVMLLSPTDGGAYHLKLLAQISRTLRDRTVAAKLRGARSDDALYSMLVQPDARAA